jgi:undecaprenyl-diphosphatase
MTRDSPFPSTHSSWPFAAATAIFMKFKKAGIATFVVAALIAFGRLYMFVHFLTDVLARMIMGIIMGIAAVKICDLVEKRKAEGMTK